MSERIQAAAVIIAFSVLSFLLGYCSDKKRQRDAGWQEGREYEIQQAKLRRDKRGRWKNRTDKNQFTATI